MQFLGSRFFILSRILSFIIVPQICLATDNSDLRRISNDKSCQFESAFLSLNPAASQVTHPAKCFIVNLFENLNLMLVLRFGCLKVLTPSAISLSLVALLIHESFMSPKIGSYLRVDSSGLTASFSTVPAINLNIKELSLNLIYSQLILSFIQNSCSFSNTCLLKWRCSLSLAKLISNCSKELESKISNP